MLIGFSDMKIFLMVFMRIAGLFSFAPVLNNKSFPLKTKVLLSFFISFMIFPILRFSFPENVSSIHDDVFSYGYILIKESSVGLIFGGLLNVLFSGILTAGYVIGFQMGLSMASVYDPEMGGETEIISQFQYLLAATLFFILDGHHRLIEAITYSYQIIPIGKVLFEPSFFNRTFIIFQTLFSLSLRLGAPVMVSLWVANFCLALLARLIPQINIFVVDFPIKCAAGCVALTISVPCFCMMFQGTLDVFWKNVHLIFETMKG